MTFRPLAARSPHKPPGRARRNKVLADSADDPDDAEKPDDLHESDNSDNSDDSLIPSWACYQAVKSALDQDFRGPGRGPKVSNSY